MTRKIAAGLVGGVIVALLGASILRAQKKEHPRATVWSASGQQPWLGVQLAEVTPEKARELKLPGEYGAIVTEVEEDGPAAKAGLAANDVILEFAGERVRGVAQLRRLVRETPPGRTVAIQVSHAGQTRKSNVALEARHDALGPDNLFAAPNRLELPEIHIPSFEFTFVGTTRLGISADELTSQLAEYFGVKQGKGVLVREVMPGSAAEKAGLKAGDCIVRVDSTEVGSVDDLHRALTKSGESSGEKREVSLTIVRDRHEQTIKAELERHRLPRHTADVLGRETDELARLNAETEALAPVEQTMLFWGDDNEL